MAFKGVQIKDVEIKKHKDDCMGDRVKGYLLKVSVCLPL